MTCVVGIESDGRVYIGGDSAGVAGWSLTVRADEKVFTTGPFIMGFTTSFRMGQLLRYNLTVSSPTVGCDDDRFMSTVFIDAVRTTLKAGGFATLQDSQEAGGSFLVGYNGRLYEVGSDYQIGRSADGYLAVGAGAEIALGALYATSGRRPAARLRTALEAAERCSGAVRSPFTMLSSP